MFSHSSAFENLSLIHISNNSSSSRTGIITFTQGESGKTCTLTIVQEAGDVYEFYITDSVSYTHLNTDGIQASLNKEIQDRKDADAALQAAIMSLQITE